MRSVLSEGRTEELLSVWGGSLIGNERSIGLHLVVVRGAILPGAHSAI